MNGTRKALYSAILTDAHTATRAIVRAFPGTDYHVTLAAAMRESWHVYGLTGDGETAAAQWAAMDPDQQTGFLVAMTWHAKQHLDIGTGPDGQPRRVVMDWITDQHDAITNAGEAWLIMPRMLRNADPDAPLAAVVCKAVLRAAERVKNATYGSPRVIKRASAAMAARTGLVADQEYIDGDGRGPVKARTVSPYDHASSVDALEHACRDNVDRVIAAARIEGYTQKEIAARTGLTQKTISTRLRAMAERYHAADAEDADCLAYRIRKRLA